ncbi:hypothetical protein AX16_001846 [Volvariella volvacea WC 439]|nr:hypothetical protein AX16_001846 [Volvariella volvacea WC 439]
MPTHKPYDHPIDFIPGKDLLKPSKVYPLTPKQRNSLDLWIDEELRKGYIRPSTSPLAASFFFVPKANGDLQPCMDYRNLNEVIVKNRYPIPQMQDMYDTLSKASIFTKIDLCWGYNNARIREGDEWKTLYFKT